MLDNFEKIGIREGYFEKSLIKDIPQSECKNSTIEVIDYDKSKKKFMESLNKIGMTQDFKSCDCLKLNNKSNRIDFIEIKGLKEYILRYKTSKKPKKPQKQIEKFGVEMKYNDSCTILKMLIQLFSEELGIKVAERLKKMKPTYIILTDIDLKENSRKRFTATLSYLSNRESASYFVQMSSDLVKCFDAEFNKMKSYSIEKKLMCERELEEYYSNDVS